MTTIAEITIGSLWREKKTGFRWKVDSITGNWIMLHWEAMELTVCPPRRIGCAESIHIHNFDRKFERNE